jgi:hypothetical protein
MSIAVTATMLRAIQPKRLLNTKGMPAKYFQRQLLRK